MDSTLISEQSASKRHADMNSEDPDERYLARLDHGLFPLQLVCVLIAQLHSPMASELKVHTIIHEKLENKTHMTYCVCVNLLIIFQTSQRVHQLMKQYGASLDDVRSILEGMINCQLIECRSAS